MKCVVGFLVFAVCALQMISASPVRNRGMIYYQSQPNEYYNAHRAFIMQYASQPLKDRRNGQAAGVSAYASGKKIAAKTYLKHAEFVEEDEQTQHDPLEGGVQSVAEAYPSADEAEQNEDEEATFIANHPVADLPAADVPVADAPEQEAEPEVPRKHKKTPVVLDEEEDEEDEAPVRSRKTGAAGGTYFPVTFGSTNGGAIAIANSYSTGKASSRATAYGSAAKPKKRTAHQ